MKENDVTKKIEKLETENRRLTMELKSQETPPMRVELDLDPVFDSRGELENLSGILGAIIHLMGKPDEELDYLQTLLLDIQETVANCAEALAGAIEKMKIVDRSEATKSAAAVDPDKNVFSRLARLREFYDSLKDSERPEDADVLTIHLRLNELSSFIINAANPAIRLKEDFLALLNDIAARQKTPAATVAAAAGA